MDEHVIEVLGKTRVVISGGEIVYVGVPKIGYCPLAERFPNPINKISQESVLRHVRWCIENYGLCTANRVLESRETFVEFGASETLYSCLRRGMLDCCVIVGDCIGTVITKRADVVQGIGGKLSGVIKTTPIPSVVKRLKMLDSTPYRDGAIDQIGGFKKAVSLGFKKIGITVTVADEAVKIRKLASEFRITPLIIGVHLTGISRGDAQQLIDNSDVVTGCASKYVRSLAGDSCLLQVGSSMPVYAVTCFGKEALLERAKDVWKRLSVKISMNYKHRFASRIPTPLI